MSEAGAGVGVPDLLVKTVAALLADEGPAAVQARRVAREIGASTTAVYHYFGGMPELLRAVVEEGFRRLDAELATVPISDDPVADICRLALAYRKTARRNPHLYDLMFGLSAPGGYRPAGMTLADSPANTKAARGAYAHLVNAAERAMRAGRLRAGEPAHAAAQLWSILHGYVTLELSGHFAQVEDSATRILLPMGTNLLVGLGDSREMAERSSAQVLAESRRDRT
jgi:AcrR family transcriptional regulator